MGNNEYPGAKSILLLVMCVALNGRAGTSIHRGTVPGERTDEEMVELVTLSDLNYDDYVDTRDVAIAVSAWLAADCGLLESCSGADIYPPGGDGKIDFKDLAMILEAWGHCLDPTNLACTHRPLTLYEPPSTKIGGDAQIIRLSSGEFVEQRTDLQIPGRGINLKWARTYRSRTGSNTRMGNGWVHSYDIYLESSGGNLILHDGQGRRDTYRPQPSGAWTAKGFFRELTREPDGSFTLTFANKGTWTFHPLDDPNAPGKMDAVTDRNGNAMRFKYDSAGRLTVIHDSLDTQAHNRDILIAYNADGLIESVSDWTGRRVRYAYYGDGDPNGSAGDLKSVTTPAVTGTPTGNDFPDGKTTVYTYSTGSTVEQLNHNLLTVTDPNGQTYLQNTYGANADDPSFDRVVRMRLGRPGDVIDYTYYRQVPEPDNNYAVSRTVRNDRMGNVSEHFFSNRNELLILRQYTGRANPDSPTSIGPDANPPTNPLRSDDQPHFETRYQYNEDYLLTRIDYPNGNYTKNIYQAYLDPNEPIIFFGNLRERHRFAGAMASVSDQRQITELFEYDPAANGGTNFPTLYTDGLGNRRRYDYDPSGNCIRKTFERTARDPNISYLWEYNKHGQLTAAVQPDNGSGHRRRDEFTYYDTGPARGYLRSTVLDSDNLALTTSYEYDPIGNITRVTDPNGNDTRYVVNQLNQLVRRISREVSAGSGVRYERDFYYDWNNNLIRVDFQNIDTAGRLMRNTHFTTTHEYDVLNNRTRMSTEVDPNNSIVTEREYDDNYNLTLIRSGEATNGNQPNNTVRMLYDERGLVFRVIRAEDDPNHSTTQYDYDGNGNLKKIAQGLEGTPRITTLESDGFNRCITSYNQFGNEGDYSYSAVGNIVSMRLYGELIDVEGNSSNVRLYEARGRYDNLNRLIHKEVSHFDPNAQTPIGDGNSVTQIFYSDNSQVLRMVDDNGHPTFFEYDTAGRSKSLTDAKGNKTIFSHDNNSNVTTITEVDVSDLSEPNKVFVTSWEYDRLNRPARITDPIGGMTSYTYDSRGNLTSRIDALNNTVRFEYDGIGRLVRTIRDMDGDGVVICDPNEVVLDPNQCVHYSSSYDDNSRLIAQTDDNGNTTGYEWDVLGRITRMAYADGTFETFKYDVHDNLVRRTYATGSTTFYDYDKVNRLVGKTILPGDGVAHTSTFAHFKYDGLSQLVYAGNDDSTVKFKRDSLSNVVEETLNGRKTNSVYDGVGNMLSLTYPGGRTIDYAYDQTNRVREVIEGPNTVASYRYIGPGRLRRQSYGNNTHCNYTYDGAKRIVGTTHVYDPGGLNIVMDKRTYAWSPTHNKIQRKDMRSKGPQLTHDYTYDPARRLVHTTVTDSTASVVRDTNYDIDGVGNRTFVAGALVSGPYTQDPSRTGPADAQVNQYTSTPGDTRQYDKNGNLTMLDNDAPGTLNIKYDYRNRMVEYTDGATGQRHTYTYDVFSRRIAKVVDADGIAGGPYETRYYFDGGQTIEERNGVDATQATYGFGNNRTGGGQVTMQRNGAEYYYHTDDSGNIMVVTDGNGIAERYRYGDYGSTTIVNGLGEQIMESAIGNPCMFKGLRYDAEAGLYCGASPHPAFGASVYFHCATLRYLDPVAGRYIQRGEPDTLGNAYTAFGNNPWSSSPAPVARVKSDFTRGFVGGGPAGQLSAGLKDPETLSAADVVAELNGVSMFLHASNSPSNAPAGIRVDPWNGYVQIWRSGSSWESAAPAEMSQPARITSLPVGGDVLLGLDGGAYQSVSRDENDWPQLVVARKAITNLPLAGDVFYMPAPKSGAHDGMIMRITDMPVSGEVFAIASFPVGDDVYLVAAQNGGSYRQSASMLRDMPVSGESFAVVPDGGFHQATTSRITDMPVSGEVFALLPPIVAENYESGVQRETIIGNPTPIGIVSFGSRGSIEIPQHYSVGISPDWTAMPYDLRLVRISPDWTAMPYDLR